MKGIKLLVAVVCAATIWTAGIPGAVEAQEHILIERLAEQLQAEGVVRIDRAREILKTWQKNA